MAVLKPLVHGSSDPFSATRLFVANSPHVDLDDSNPQELAQGAPLFRTSSIHLPSCTPMEARWSDLVGFRHPFLLRLVPPTAGGEAIHGGTAVEASVHPDGVPSNRVCCSREENAGKEAEVTLHFDSIPTPWRLCENLKYRISESWPRMVGSSMQIGQWSCGSLALVIRRGLY